MDFKKAFSQLRTGDLELRPNTLDGRQGMGRALFGEGYWFNNISSSLDSKVSLVADQMRCENEVELLREKEKTLSSLEKFVVEKTQQKQEKCRQKHSKNKKR